MVLFFLKVDVEVAHSFGLSWCLAPLWAHVETFPSVVSVAILLSLESILTRGHVCGGVVSRYLSVFTDSSQICVMSFL